MPTINELYEAVGKLRIKEVLPAIIKKTEYPLVLKIIGQHQKGLLSTNQKITPSYASAYYSRFKSSLNPAPGYGIPDAHVTGAYDSELHVTVNGDEYSIDSDVSYAQSASLTQYDVSNTFNLPSDQSKEEYWQESLVPEIREYIGEVTGL